MHRAQRKRFLSLCALLCIAALAPAAGARSVDFLVPGIPLESVSLAPGARVSYLVITTSFGAVDSSYVELRVLDRAKGEVRIEVISSPYPRKAAESITVRLRLLDRVTAISSPAEFAACLREMRIREGTGKFREATEDERDEFDAETLFLPVRGDAVRTELPTASIAVPAGVFRCAGARISTRTSRALDLGGIRTERIEEETSVVRVSSEIPFWGLVRATVERRSITKSSAAREGSSPEPRVTTTESSLLSYKKPRGRS